MKNIDEQNTKKDSTPPTPENDIAMAEQSLEMFASNLRVLRKVKKLSQDAFDVEEGHLQQSTISRIEKHRQDPSLKQAILISRILGVPLNKMLSEDYSAFRRNTKKFFPGGTIKGKRPSTDTDTFKRFKGVKLFCYYYSGSGTLSLREGNLIIQDRCGGEGLFIAGKLETHSQVYDCKIVVEHPSYIFVFGNNHNIPERIFIVLHEPRYTEQQKSYIGGIGIVVSENSNQVPYAQKIVFSQHKLSIEKHQTVLSNFLQVSTNDKYGFCLESDIDNRFYNWLRDQYPDT